MCKKLFFLFYFIFSSAEAIAGISLDSTRVVFLEKNAKQGKSIGVTSNRESEAPYLVSAQIVSSPEGDNTNTPFVVSPSLFRLEPGTTNQLRIMQVPGKAILPRDKESIFYLRVIAQPSGKSDDHSTDNHLGGAIVVSTASIIKVMYRPGELAVSQKQSMKGLIFSYRDGKLKVSNPSPYFVSLASLRLGVDKVRLSVLNRNTMIAPYSSQSYSINSTGNTVIWKAINDYGGIEEFKSVIQ